MQLTNGAGLSGKKNKCLQTQIDNNYLNKQTKTGVK